MHRAVSIAFVPNMRCLFFFQINIYVLLFQRIIVYIAGINPMFPGASMTSSSVSTGSESCVGPFCLGQDGGMGGSMNGGSGSTSSSGCQGPFCISGSMMGGGGGMMGGAGGGMMDGGGGMMGGTGGGMMGGGGGMMGGSGGVLMVALHYKVFHRRQC